MATNPRFEVGTKVLTFIDDVNNNLFNASTRATSTFLISGVIETVQENIVSVRNANVQTQNLMMQRDIRRQNETCWNSSSSLALKFSNVDNKQEDSENISELVDLILLHKLLLLKMIQVSF